MTLSKQFNPLFIAACLFAPLVAGCSDDDDTPPQSEGGETGTGGEEESTGGPGETGTGSETGDVPSPLTVTFLHMNDHHSHVEEESIGIDVSSYNFVDPNGDAIEEVEVPYGGMPMLANEFKRLEAEIENVVKVYAGDAMTGTLFFSIFKGEADAALLNSICFDAFALGNHEFDEGDSGLATFLGYLGEGECNTPVISANVEPGAESPLAGDLIQDYTIIEVDGQQIGMIGIDIAGKTKNSSFPDPDTMFANEIETAQRVANELMAQGLDKIVLVTHYGYLNDLALASMVTGVDVIIGGDSHTLLGSEELSGIGFTAAAEYPTQTLNADAEPVCVVQAWEYGHLLGRLDVTFDENGVVSSCGGTPVMPVDMATFAYEYEVVEMDESKTVTGTLADNEAAMVATIFAPIPEVVAGTRDTATQAVFETFNSQVAELGAQVIGAAGTDLCLARFPNDLRNGECVEADVTYLHGSDVTNLVAKAYLFVTPTAELAIQNAGGVRENVFAGDYTLGDANALVPFSNTMVTLELTGAQVRQVLEDAIGFAISDIGANTGAYPYAAGLRYDVNVDVNLPAGTPRISNVEVNPRLEGEWTPIVDDQVYTVVTNDFIAAGKDGYATFAIPYEAGNFVNTFTLYTQGWINYVEAETAADRPLVRLPEDEYSTQLFTDLNGCVHNDFENRCPSPFATP